MSMRFRGKANMSFAAARRLGWLNLIIVIILSWSAASAWGQVTFNGTQFSLASGPLNAPASVAADGRGNVYIADTGNNRVLELSPSGAGFGAPVTILSGLSSPGGVASDWSGNVFVSDTGNGRIVELPVVAAGFGAMVTVVSGLSSPAGLALDSVDDVYVANSGNNDVLQVLLANGVYQTPVVVGTGFSHPMGVALDAKRNVYVADTGNSRVVEVLFSSAGYRTQQQMWVSLSAPMGLAIDKAGDVYIAVNGGQEVLEKLWAAGANRFGGSSIIGTGLNAPSGVAVTASGQVFIADAVSDRVLNVQTVSLEFGTVAVGAAGSSLTYNFTITAGTTLGGISIFTQGVSGKDFVDGGASTCVAQTYATTTSCGVNVRFNPLASGARMGSIVLWGSTGSPLSTAFISGLGALSKIGFIPGAVTQLGSQLSGPSGVAVDGQGNVYISDTGNNRVVELPWTGSGYGTQIVVPINGLVNPMGLTIDGAGNLYVASNGNDKVIYLPWTLNGFGAQSKVGTGLYGPSNVVVGGNGTVFIADTLDNRLDQILWTGNGFAQETEVGVHEAPIGVAVDAAGNLYTSDPYENNLAKMSWSGTQFVNEALIPVTGSWFPYALATDANQDLFVLDAVENEVVMLPWNGTSYGAPITVANGFNSPSGMTIDSNGVLYVADTGNNRVVKIDMSVPGGMSYSSTYLGATSADSPKAMLLGNLGNLPVTLGAVTYPADFPEGTAGSGGCSERMVLSASAWCELAVKFTPSVVSSLLSETVTVSDDSLGVAGNLQGISVSGVSLAKVAQTISFTAPAATVYGAPQVALVATATSGLPVTFSVVSGPGTLVSGGKVLRFSGAGTVVLQAVQNGNGEFSAAPTVSVSVRVAAATLTVTPKSVTAIYGAIPASFGYSVAGFVNGDSASVVSGAPVISCAVKPSAGVGSYVLSAAVGKLTAANYIFAFSPGTLTVSPAVLQVRAISQSTVYGKAIASLQWGFSGFVNGDGPGAVTGTPILTTAANSRSGVGSYSINVSTGTLNARNYNFTFVGGAVTINTAPLTVAAANQTITYGSATPAVSYTISGFVNGDTQAKVVKGNPVVVAQASSRPGAGKYPLTVAQGALSAANYNFVLIAGVLTVQKAAIQVNPGNATMTYGAKVPEFSYTMVGFVNGDSAKSSISGSPALTSAANSRSTPGTFAITAGLGSLSANNYSFSLGSGVLTVTKAALTVIPGELSVTYGSALPHLTYSFSGLLNGDTVGGAVSGTPQLVTTATSSSAVGSYGVSAALGSLTAKNYSFTFKMGTVTVTKAQLTVTASNCSMSVGGSVPALSYTVKGFANGETQATATSGKPSLSTTATSTSKAGSYTVVAAEGSLSAKNYAFTFVNGTLTVNQ